MLNLFKNIFGRIWALWGLLSFILTFILFFPVSMLAYAFKDEVKGQEYFITVARCWMKLWLFLIACPLRITGKEYFEKNRNYIVTFNHNALLDVPLSAPFIPGANKTIAKDSFAKVPVFGLFYKRGSVLLNRKDESSRIKSYEEMKKVLTSGMHMCIYPEGTRNRSSKPLKDFYDGAFKLAVDTQKAIMPCVIIGTKQAMPIHKTFYLFPTKLSMHFLPPVDAGSNDKMLKQQVYELMLQAYTTLYK